MKLYELSESYRALLEQCDDSDTDITAALAEIDADIEDKVKNGIGLIQTLKRQAESYNAEIARLTRLKKTAENNLERIQQYYLENLKYTGKERVTTALGTMAVVKAGGKKPLIIDDEKSIPTAYKFARYEVDKESLRDDLENGEVVTGAHLGERSSYLRIY